MRISALNIGRIAIIIAMGCLLSFDSNAQIVRNGTFDGIPGAVSIPFEWESCFGSSTVDIQPGAFGVIHSPVDGTGYVGMACRSLSVDNAGTCEEINQSLNETLIAGRCYQVEVSLARSLDLNVVEFRNPIDLEVSIGDAACQTKLDIVHFGPIEHTAWRKYTGIFSPTEDMTHLWLRAVYSNLPEYSGYLLMDNIVITEAQSPELTEFEICRGSTVNLSAHIDNAETYSWNTGETTKTISVSQPGNYSVDISNAGCTIRRQFRVDLKPSPEGAINSEVRVCPGESTVLDVFQDGATYLWHDGSTTSTFEATSPGVYSVFVRVGDCGLEKTITVVEHDPPVFNLPDNIVLCGNDPLRLNVAQDNATYLWHDGSSESFFDVTGPGTHSVQITLNGCSEQKTFNITQGSNPIVDLGSVNHICPGEQIRLDVFENNASYQWQDGSEDSFFVVNVPGTYSVEVTLNGCTSFQSIEVFRGECDPIFEMPNAFTPNGDGKNDRFTPIRSINILQMQTQIFNRWGHPILSTENLNIEWDGTLPNGKEAPPTTYYWSVKYSDLDGFVHQLKGSVSLIR